jgi:YidC/Oxa1 family membrane protein insertase
MGKLSEQRNLILAIALSLAVLLGFQYFYEIPRMEQQRTQEAMREAAGGGTASAPAPGEAARTPEAAPSGRAPAAAPSSAVTNRDAALSESPRVPIVSGRVEGSLATVGQRIDDLSLKDYKVGLEPGSPRIVLLSPPAAPQPYYAAFGWTSGDAGLKVPDADTRWQVSGDRLAPDQPVTLSWDNGQGLLFTRTVEIDANFMFTVTQRVENRGDKEVALSAWGMLSRTDTPPTLGFFILHEGPVGVLGETLRELDYDEVGEGAANATGFDSTGGWLGITDKYWLVALVPNQNDAVKARFFKDLDGSRDRYQADYLGNALTVAPGAAAQATSRFFAGAKEVRLLDAYEERLGIKKFDLAVDFGWFYFLTKPFFYFLDYIYRQTGNFGIAILLLTVCVKLVFFPLANKSYKAMSRMKALQPEIVRLREKYGEDRQKLNQEMMALYKTQKVNPAAGCLPIAIQIPVFFALYKVLFVTIEMRHAPFFGWIHDLSAPDPLLLFNLFGLIPWQPPQFLYIGIWPVLMGITMYLQQKLNPQPADPVQAKVFQFMPLFFVFLLGSFPAGLVIYWTWNNILSMAQQYVIMKRMGVPIGGKT